jgi:hypothetical protein
MPAPAPGRTTPEGSHREDPRLGAGVLALGPSRARADPAARRERETGIKSPHDQLRSAPWLKHTAAVQLLSWNTLGIVHIAPRSDADRRLSEAGVERALR